MTTFTIFREKYDNFCNEQAPTVTPEELEDVRRRFQRNAHLLHTVLKASQVRAPSAERDSLTACPISTG